MRLPNQLVLRPLFALLQKGVPCRQLYIHLKREKRLNNIFAYIHIFGDINIFWSNPDFKKEKKSNPDLVWTPGFGYKNPLKFIAIKFCSGTDSFSFLVGRIHGQSQSGSGPWAFIDKIFIVNITKQWRQYYYSLTIYYILYTNWINLFYITDFGRYNNSN